VTMWSLMPTMESSRLGPIPNYPSAVYGVSPGMPWATMMGRMGIYDIKEYCIYCRWG
jgi:hypothetical protein